MNRNDPERDQGIAAIVDAYFNGVYSGDAASLSALFDVDAQVYGEVDGQPYHQTIHAYLDGGLRARVPRNWGNLI